MARVVVADNDPDALDLLLMDLRLEGHEVHGAPDAARAQLMIEALDPHVAVLDHRMPPGEDGLSLAERLVREHLDLRVLLYTNYQGIDLRLRAAAIDVPLLVKGNLRALRAAVIAP
ncbi:response regulator [Nocardioides sp.]|uniref:response regulator n=1 Tax=Nocardioides sp. TaxID=35761 RepID=UPI002B27C105|nr:response regulator [Nocardioides sp.]